LYDRRAELMASLREAYFASGRAASAEVRR
jgi:hypothetical protein